MKIKIQRIIKAIAFMLIFCVLFSGATYILRNKNEANIVLPFYNEPKNTLDVIFIGSSHLMCSVYPMELYDKYGIASYVFASSAQLLPQSYYQLKEALRFQNPKMIVLDISSVIYDTKISTTEYAHVQIDNMSFSPVKYEAIWDLFDKDSRAEYIFNIIRFHSRWKELGRIDFSPISSCTKGAYVSTDCTPCQPNRTISPNEKYEIFPTAEKYLRMILDLCKEKQIEVLLFNAPAVEEHDSLPRCNAVNDIADEYGLEFIDLNLNADLISFDPATDYRDPWHCNAKGAMKVTTYLGDFIDTHYKIPDRRNDKNYDFWNEQLSEYRNQYHY